LTVGEVRFEVYPQDHEPMHVHGFIGSGEVIVDLLGDGSVGVAKRWKSVFGANRSEVRKVLRAAAAAYDELAKLWEKMHDS
jgi:hypothetical protein